MYLCAQSLSCVQLFATPWTASLPSSSVCGDSPGKNTGVGCHTLFQQIFPTQGSNPGLLHCRQILYCLRHQGSPIISDVSIFSCAFWPSVCLLWRNVYLDLLATLRLSYFLLLSCVSCLCILEIDPLLVALYTDIVPHSVDCFFVLFMVSFAVQKLLSFIRSHLFIFVFIFITLGGGSKKILLLFM